MEVKVECLAAARGSPLGALRRSRLRGQQRRWRVCGGGLRIFEHALSTKSQVSSRASPRATRRRRRRVSEKDPRRRARAALAEFHPLKIAHFNRRRVAGVWPSLDFLDPSKRQRRCRYCLSLAICCRHYELAKVCFKSSPCRRWALARRAPLMAPRKRASGGFLFAWVSRRRRSRRVGTRLRRERLPVQSRPLLSAAADSLSVAGVRRKAFNSATCASLARRLSAQFREVAARRAALLAGVGSSFNLRRTQCKTACPSRVPHSSREESHSSREASSLGSGDCAPDASRRAAEDSRLRCSPSAV